MSTLIQDPTRILFFMGKGGVGKTSAACATAIGLVDAGQRVLLVSTDPASNHRFRAGRARFPRTCRGALSSPAPCRRGRRHRRAAFGRLHPGDRRVFFVLTNVDVTTILRSRMVKRALTVLAEVAVEACCPTLPKLRPAATTPYAKLFKALGDETRLEILGLLAAAGAEICACDIESHFDLSQPTISHHLKILREAGLVTGERRGTWVYYAMDRATVARLGEFQKLVGG